MKLSANKNKSYHIMSYVNENLTKQHKEQTVNSVSKFESPIHHGRKCLEVEVMGIWL